MRFNLGFIINVELPRSGAPGTSDQQSVDISPTDSPATVVSSTSTSTTVQPVMVTVSGNLCLERGLNRLKAPWLLCYALPCQWRILGC